MKRLIKISLTTIFLVAIFGLVPALAQDLSQITFPIAELGNCADPEECKSYCDQPENFDVCLDFASKKKIMSEKEIETAKKLGAEFNGPGGCSTKEKCKTYCDQPGHSQECIEFAIEHDIIPPEEQAEAKQVLEHLQTGGTTPGNCSSKESCETYCDDSTHAEECTEFAISTGLMSADEAEMMRKTGGKGPGGCEGQAECDAYCNSPQNFEVCINFSVEHGMMSAEEAERIRQMGPEMMEGPGGCQEREECDAYCDNPEHTEECLDFGVKHGMMTPEEADMAKKMGHKIDGPGGCQAREECDAYCENPDHTEECIKFSVEHGFMTEKEARRMKQGPRIPEGAETPGGCQGQECEVYCQDPEHQEECYDFAVKYDLRPPDERGEPGKHGPGGCFGEECHNYCDDPENFDECHEFAEGQGVEVRLPPEIIKHKQEEWVEEHPGEKPPPPKYFKQQAGEFSPEELERKKQEWTEEHPGETPPPMQEFKKFDEGMSPEEWEENRQEWLKDRPGEAFEEHPDGPPPTRDQFNIPSPDLTPEEWEEKQKRREEEFTEGSPAPEEYFKPGEEWREESRPRDEPLDPKKDDDWIGLPEPGTFDMPPKEMPYQNMPVKKPGVNYMEPTPYEPPKMNTDEPMPTGSTGGGAYPGSMPITPEGVPSGGGSIPTAPSQPTSGVSGGGAPPPPPPVEVKGEILIIESPGGCLGAKECLTYCANPKHWNECWEWRYFK